MKVSQFRSVILLCLPLVSSQLLLLILGDWMGQLLTLTVGVCYLIFLLLISYCFFALVVTIGFVENDFQQNEEPNSMMRVLLRKNGILAQPVRFRVTPLTVDDAFSQDIITVDMTREFIPEFPSDNPYSPSKAGKLLQKITNALGAIFVHR